LGAADAIGAGAIRTPVVAKSATAERIAAVRKRRRPGGRSPDNVILPPSALEARLAVVRCPRQDSGDDGRRLLPGLRPSEVVRLRAKSLELPREGWGHISVAEADVDFDVLLGLLSSGMTFEERLDDYEDLERDYLLRGAPRRLLRVTTGNISNADLIALFRHRLDAIEEAFRNLQAEPGAGISLTGRWA